jgi:hypothetical protein
MSYYIRNRRNTRKAAKALEKERKLLEAQRKALSTNNATTVTGEDGMRRVDGGTNLYGHERPDHLLLRDDENKVHQAFRETVSDTFDPLRDYGKQLGQDVDERAKIQMGDAYKKLEAQAMGEGDMDDTAFMRKQVNNQTLKDMGRVGTQNLNNLNSMQSQMAMRGGVGGGASERMAKSSMRDNLFSQQNVMGQNRDQNLQLSINNAQNRNNMLRDVGQMQQNIGQYNANAFNNNFNRQLDTLSNVGRVEQDVMRSNIGAARDDLDKQNAAGQKLYQEDMAAWGAKESAKAQAAAAPKSGGGMCFFTTAACDVMGMSDDCWVLETARSFRDKYMSTDAKRAFELAEYYDIAPVLLNELDGREDKVKVLKSLFWKHIVPFCKLVTDGKNEDARVAYQEMMNVAKLKIKGE